MLLAAAAASLAGAHRATAAVPAPGNWSLVFDDEFNGTALDTVDWNYAYPWSQHGLADDSVEEPANVTVGGGAMTFTALPQGQWYGGTYYNYTSGAVNTSGKLNFTYGYIEASQKFSSATGTWPAYWMLQNGWPPEIDVEEYPNGPGSGSNANSYSSGWHYSTGSGNGSAGPGIRNEGNNLASGYNYYGVDWEPTSLTFYFNGSAIGSISGSQYNIAQAAGMYLLLDMGVGGWPGEPPSGAITSASPATMETDFVRVWQNTSNTNNQVNWIKAGSDSWDDSAAWSGGIANQSNLTAYFGVLSSVQSNEVISWTGTRVVNGLTFQSNSNYTLGVTPGTVAGGGEGIELTSPDGVPTGSETPTVNINGFNQSGQGSVTINAQIQVQFSAITLSVNNYLNSPMVFNGDMIGPGAMILTAGGMTINANDQLSGNLTVQNGALEVGSTGQISGANVVAIAPGGSVKLDSGSALVANAWLSVGSSAGGTGTLNISGATVTANTDFNIGDVTGSSGVVIMSGGSINCANFYLGKSGTATGLLVQTGGAIGPTAGTGGDWRIGGAASAADSAAVGIYNLSGGTFTSPVNTQVGAYGHGIVNQTGGTVTVGNYLSIGRFPGSVGVYNMASGGGTLTANTAPDLIVGEQGTGTLLVGGTAHVNAKLLSIGHSDGTSVTGTVIQTGGTVTATTGVEFGTAASGSAVVNGNYTLSGGVLATPSVTQNPLSTVTGTFNFNGGALQPTAVAASLFQGVTNVRVQAGGALINAVGLHLTLGETMTHDPALGAAPDGGLTKGGFNTLTIAAPMTYTGATSVTAGTLQLSGGSNLLPVTAAVNLITAGSTLDLNGVNQSLAALNGVAGSVVTLGTGTLTINNSAADTFNGNISGSGGVTKTGTGSLTLGGTTTYTGATNISAGNVTFTANTSSTPLVRPMGAITVGAAGRLTVASETNHNGRQVIQAGSLALNPSATLDLGNNDLDIATASLTTISNLVAAGYSLTGGGTWTGTGITSTAAAAAADTAHLTALGVIQNNQNGSPIYSAANPFDTTVPGPADVLVKYTYFGDANLDGVVDGSDYSLIDAGFASRQPGYTGPVLSGWLNGDFNDDGTIDGSDYALIDNAFNNQSTAFTGGTTALTAATTAQVAGPVSVPEPASLAVLTGVLAVARCRRRRS